MVGGKTRRGSFKLMAINGANRQLVSGAYAGLFETLGRTAREQMSYNTQAADIMTQVSKDNIKYLERQSAIAQANLAPFVEAGKKGSQYLETLLGFNGAQAQQQYMDQIMSSPYVTSSIKLGQEAVQSSAAAKGMLDSGRTMEELFRVGQDVGSREIASTQDALLKMSGQGANAAAGVANLAYQQGKDVSEQNTMGAEAQAGALIKNGQIYADSENAIAGLQMQAAMQGLDPTGQNAKNAGGGTTFDSDAFKISSFLGPMAASLFLI